MTLEKTVCTFCLPNKLCGVSCTGSLQETCVTAVCGPAGLCYSGSHSYLVY